jgi:signal transduction histidine kinase
MVAVPAGRPEVVAPRLARVVVFVVVGGFFGLMAMYVLGAAGSLTVAVAGLAVLAAHAALLVPTLLAGAARAWPWLMAGQVVLTYLPLVLWPHIPMLWGLSTFLAGACLVRLRPPYSWLCYGLVSVSTLPIAWWYEKSVSAQFYALVTIAGVGFLLYAMAWLRQLATDLPVTEARAAAIEVARERQRLLRDAHDLLGFRLSALVLKLELARRGADAEVAEARAQALAAIAEARSLAAERPELSFATELAAAGALLAAAGIELDAPTEAPEADALLATVLREAVTNVLRHSTARRCSIALTADRRTVKLVVTNDGALDLPDRVSWGTGLASLTDRVTAVGGTLRVTACDGVFTLEALMPVRRPSGPGPATPVVPAVGLVVLAALVALSLTFPDPALLDATFVLLTAAFGACLAYLCWPRRPAVWRPVFAALVLLAYVPLLHYPTDAWVLRHYVGGVVLLLLRGQTRWLAAGAILAAEVALVAAGVAPVTSLAYHLTADIDNAVAIFALVQLPLLTGALARAQARLATTAVARERLRFADQLGERLGDRLHRVLETLASSDARHIASALEQARAAAADLRAVARS